jgi:YD repeat-containing protein
MRITYDAEADALSIIFRDTTVTTADLAEGITAEYDASGRLVGIEILDAARRFDDPSVFRHVTLEGVGLAPTETR